MGPSNQYEGAGFGVVYEPENLQQRMEHQDIAMVTTVSVGGMLLLLLLVLGLRVQQGLQ